MTKPVIRAGAAADAAACRTVERLGSEQYRDSAFPEVAEIEVRPASAFAARASAGELLVADLAGEIAGFVLLAQDGAAAHVEEIDVDPGFQRQGVGAALLDAAAEWGRARGATRLTLTTFRDVAWNEPYYRRRGFETLAPEDQPPLIRAETERYAAEGWGEDERLAMVRSIA